MIFLFEDFVMQICGFEFSLFEYRLVERLVIQSICRASLQFVVHELLLQNTAVLPACLPN